MYLNNLFNKFGFRFSTVKPSGAGEVCKSTSFKLLEFESGALEAAADRAIEMKIGARGLRSVMENVMTDVMYSVPSDDDAVKVIITEDCVKNGTQPVIVHKN